MALAGGLEERFWGTCLLESVSGNLAQRWSDGLEADISIKE